jgi:hypothetical protein
LDKRFDGNVRQAGPAEGGILADNAFNPGAASLDLDAARFDEVAKDPRYMALTDV